MGISYQQAEALTYFDRVSAEWRMKAEGKAGRVNVIAQRHACIHRLSHAVPQMRAILDVGCGTGELVLEMAAKGIDSAGIDFAPEMIRACEEKRRQTGLHNANFTCCSVFEFDPGPESKDMASALGFIEYISPNQLSELLGFSHRVLRPGGILALGSRNRLFNVVSLNAYTKMEVELGVAGHLLDEAVALTQAPSVESALSTAPQAALTQPKSHPSTGIEVRVRYQYTPRELAALLRETGFEPMAVYPVHYHAMTPDAAAARRDLYIAFSELIFASGELDHRLVPFSSSFVIGARKR